MSMDVSFHLDSDRISYELKKWVILANGNSVSREYYTLTINQHEGVGDEVTIYMTEEQISQLAQYLSVQLKDPKVVIRRE